MTVTEKIKTLNDDLLKYATSKNQDTCQRIVMNEGKIHIEDMPIVYGEFQIIPRHRGGRIYPRDQYWNCLDPIPVKKAIDWSEYTDLL